MKNLLITGGCGFIASNLINYLSKSGQYNIVNIDKMSYCANINNVEIEDQSKYTLIPGNICDPDLVLNLLKIHQIDVILHLAAQSHVDNSFGNSLQFTKDNIVGTHNLLECSKKYGKLQKFIYMSTDEVEGDFNLKEGGKMLNPTNPYAATKAASELLVESYAKSFKLPTTIIRSNNVYGPRQYWEKLIPRFIVLLEQGKKLTIQGDGNQTRTFVYVEDVCRAIELVMEKGELYQIYSIGTDNEYSVRDIAEILIRKIHGIENVNLDVWITFIKDRDFNDSRYVVDPSKLVNLGWSETGTFEENLSKTVTWYQNHPDIKKEESDCH